MAEVEGALFNTFDYTKLRGETGIYPKCTVIKAL